MKRRLLIGLFALLLASAVIGFYRTRQDVSPSLPPPSAIPTLPVEEKREPVKQALPAAVEIDEEEEEPQEQTVRASLKKEALVNTQQPPDTTLSLKKAKPREIFPGVTLENKELSIQLEEENESLNIRRAKTPREQMQMMWKQKF